MNYHLTSMLCAREKIRIQIPTPPQEIPRSSVYSFVGSKYGCGAKQAGPCPGLWLAGRVGGGFAPLRRRLIAEARDYRPSPRPNPARARPSLTHIGPHPLCDEA